MAGRFRSFLSYRWKHMTLQQKLTGVFMLAAVIILGVNLYLFGIVNAMAGQVEDVYWSNVNLNELAGELDLVQSSMEEYLQTKSTDAIEEYYRSEQDYREMMEELNVLPTDDEALLAEKNIYYLSESYLQLTAETVSAKRGRNVERYSDLYEQSLTLYQEIHTFIYSLNNVRFSVNSRDYEELIVSLRNTEIISMGVLVVILAANIVLIVATTGSMTRPLHRLAEAADEVANENFEIEEIPVNSMDEIGIVTGAFNQMVKSIRNYIERLRLTMEREIVMQGYLKDAQLKYLQAQINPHFLFNTLNAGAQLATLEGADRTERFLENVADFFRYNLRKGDGEATLEEELRLVDNYVYIMNVRFPGEFIFEKDIDESVLDLKVPSMILQPLVENALDYGVKNLDRPGRIEVSVVRRDEYVSISVWDNGTGMTAEKIARVLEGKTEDAGTEPKAGTNGVGIRNVTERLRLYFKGRAKLEIFSEGIDTGTEVIISVPLCNEGENEDVPGGGG